MGNIRFIQKILQKSNVFSYAVFFSSSKKNKVGSQTQAVAVIGTNQMTRHCLTFLQFTWSIGRHSRVVHLFIILQTLFICCNK